MEHLLAVSVPAIPDEPDDASIRLVLARLVLCKKHEWRVTNQAEVDRLRGTPGEPIPVVEHHIRNVYEWLDRAYNHMTTKTGDLTSFLITAEQAGSLRNEASAPDHP
jgi:hypothetical protein